MASLTRRSTRAVGDPGAILEVGHLAKSWAGEVVVDDLSFSVPAATCFGLLGPNGAGKTTTLRCCLGLSELDGGEVRLAGRAIPGEARLARARVGVVPQADNLDPDFTCHENLLVYGRYFGIADTLIAERIPQLLDFAGLAGKQDAPIQTLSGGMKRRLTLARALINDPDILFLDEPTTGLDPQARHLIWERLKRLVAEGKTLLLTTHFMDEAERLCDRLAILDRGRIIAEGAPRGLISKHIEPQVVEVFGDDAVDWARKRMVLGERVEAAGDTAFVYCLDPAPLLSALAGEAQLRFVHRAASLEDVFLKLTGRDLRD
ncbi:ATP-binding cassette domain-containing protein [Accumulibacter sp.]|uniref:ATP-binding cassette domain-containing protein n=1 Tax=Accumulibacter sp. TaxID=2053492 RepID=UPI0025FBB25C|nr:ATP-binding cassette domain-containing protein [Accumulibacter sp.]MCM8594318.1 ATP-binding cassette domain-containing protein [Accumulibacter sp.]MCM8625047.1 ATP-binding cassette domain-containing protein [Accumulibacter sp.]MDS4048462.1 ATP-binding cassette domain-containing protein [Accumulibacter sp.]